MPTSAQTRNLAAAAAALLLASEALADDNGKEAARMAAIQAAQGALLSADVDGSRDGLVKRTLREVMAILAQGHLDAEAHTLLDAIASGREDDDLLTLLSLATPSEEPSAMAKAIDRSRGLRLD